MAAQTPHKVCNIWLFVLVQQNLENLCYVLTNMYLASYDCRLVGIALQFGSPSQSLGKSNFVLPSLSYNDIVTTKKKLI